MQALRQMGGGLVIAIISLLLVVGGISLALAEAKPPEQPTSTPLPPIIATSLELPIATPTPIIADTNTVPTPIVMPSATLALAPVVCNPPAGWFQIVVNTNDTLYTIAERYKTTAEILSVNNCLNNTVPAIGAILYVPPVPTVTVIPCGAPFSWIKAYSVQPGENLYRISLLYRTTVSQLQVANCMGGSITIYPGQLLWVPNVPTSTPGITIVPNFDTETFTPQPTFTYTATNLPTYTFTSAPTITNTPAATATPSLTPFPSQTPHQ